MTKKFEFTSESYQSSDLTAADVRSDISRHLFWKLDRLCSSLKWERRNSAAGTKDPVLSQEEILAQLAQYIRVGSLLFSERKNFSVRGMTIFNPHNDLKRFVAEAMQSTPELPAPEMVVDPDLPILYRTDENVFPLFEILIQALTAYRPKGGTEIHLSELSASHSGESPECELSITCRGARVDPSLTPEKFSKIANSLIGGLPCEWQLIGSRMAAAIMAAHNLGGMLSPVSISGDRLDFTVVLMMNRAPELAEPEAAEEHVSMP